MSFSTNSGAKVALFHEFPEAKGLGSFFHEFYGDSTHEKIVTEFFHEFSGAKFHEFRGHVFRKNHRAGVFSTISPGPNERFISPNSEEVLYNNATTG